MEAPHPYPFPEPSGCPEATRPRIAVVERFADWTRPLRLRDLLRRVQFGMLINLFCAQPKHAFGIVRSIVT